jgi:hypothetical protein
MSHTKTAQQELKEKAEKRFGTLQAAEEELLKAVVGAHWARFPLATTTGKPTVTIRGELVRWICADAGAKAYVDFFGIAIEGAEITAAERDDKGQPVLSFSSVVMPFPLQFKACVLPMRVWMFGAETTFLSFQGSTLGTLEADVVRIKGDFYLRGAKSSGVVRFPGATIGGDLDCSEIEFSNPPTEEQAAPPARTKVPADIFVKDYEDQNNGMALKGDGINVSGDVLLRRANCDGQICLEGADIRGDLNCEGAQLRNPRHAEKPTSGVALDIDRANVKGSVFLKKDGSGKQAFHARGEVRMLAAQVGSQLACSGGEFINPQIPDDDDSGDAFSADGMSVKGPVFLRNGFRAQGNVRLVGTTMARLDCRKGSFSCLNLSSATISGKLIVFHMSNAEGTKLDFSDLSVGTIRDSFDENDDLADDHDVPPRWPEKGTGKIVLNGFTYGKWFNGIASGRGRDWLERQDSFTRQPYRQLAKVLRDDGDSSGARRVLFEMEKKDSEQEGSAARGLWNFILWATVGYGYYPWIALLWLVLFFGSGLGLYWKGYDAGYITPTDLKTYEALKATGQLPPSYERFHASVYSLENCLPVVKLGLTDHWQIDPAAGENAWTAGVRNLRAPLIPIAPWFLRLFRWAHICAAWFFGGMLAAALSGLVRRE